MPHEDYVPASQTPAPGFDPASLYQNAIGLLVAEPPAPPSALRPALVNSALAVAAAGLLTLLVGAHLDSRAQATRGWVETDAEILSAKLRATNAGEYHLDVAYRYRAGPRTLQGTRLSLEPELSRDAAYAYAARFRPGTKVPLWFDPAAPVFAVLERPHILGAQVASGLGAFLLVIGLAPFTFQAARRIRYRLALRRQLAP